MLPHDVVEEILERVPVNSLVRFKGVSKLWKSTIDSTNFQKRQLIYRQQSRDPDVLFLNFEYGDGDDHTTTISSSSSVIPVRLPFEKICLSSTSCDGLVCLYSCFHSCIMINPATRWHRTLPPSNFPQLSLPYLLPNLGFGKDKINGAYKLVWLFNTRELPSPTEATTTTCEIFEFKTNSWRYLTPASPYEIIPHVATVYVDGSVHWLTKCEKTKVLSLDLHTETFQIAETPFVSIHPYSIHMCNLDNRLCIYEMKWPNQVIWLFDSGSKKLNAMYSISMPNNRLESLAYLEENHKKTKLLFYDYHSGRDVVTYDLHTKSFELIFTSKSRGYVSTYFQSLFSI